MAGRAGVWNIALHHVSISTVEAGVQRVPVLVKCGLGIISHW